MNGDVWIRTHERNLVNLRRALVIVVRAFADGWAVDAIFGWARAEACGWEDFATIALCSTKAEAEAVRDEIENALCTSGATVAPHGHDHPPT
jgi:hypothetical protein